MNRGIQTGTIVATFLGLTGCVTAPAVVMVRPGAPSLRAGQAVEVRAESARKGRTTSVEASWTVDDQAVAAVEPLPGGRGRLIGRKPGRTTLRARVGKVVAETPVDVTAVPKAPPAPVVSPSTAAPRGLTPARKTAR